MKYEDIVINHRIRLYDKVLTTLFLEFLYFRFRDKIPSMNLMESHIKLAVVQTLDTNAHIWY